MLRLAAPVLVAVACSPAPAQPADASSPDSAATTCTSEPLVPRAQFVAESVAYLRAAFGVTDGFDGGVVGYSEAYVSLDDTPCPLADWSALSYAAPIASTLVPPELRDTFDRVAAIWSLGGRKFVVFLPAEPGGMPAAAPWPLGRLPDSVTANARADADPDAIAMLAARLRTRYPTLKVDWYDEIHLLALTAPVGNFTDDPVGTLTIPQFETATDDVRTSNLFMPIEWSILNFRFPNHFWSSTTVAGDTIGPECLRTKTKPMLPLATTSPSLAPPLGAGPQAHRPACGE